MSGLFFQVLRLVEELGGRLTEIKKDKSGSNVYVFKVHDSDITVHSRCLKSFHEALISLKTSLKSEKEV